MTQVEVLEAERTIRELHVARAVIASIASQRPGLRPSECGWVEKDGERIAVIDLTQADRRYRIFIVEVVSE